MALEAAVTATTTVVLTELFKKIPAAVHKISSMLYPEEEIKFLRRILPKVKGLVLNARAQFLDDEESKLEWGDFLKGLEEFTYDAEDILDEYETEVAQCRLKLHQRSQNNLVQPQFLPSVKIAHKIRVLYRKLKKVKDSEQRIEVFVKEAMGGLEDKGDGGAAANSTGSRSSTRREVTDAMLKKDFQMAGRDEEKEQVIEKFLLGPPSELLVVVITGMGGLGKTTLAQEILRDQKVDKHFQFKRWVCLGDGERDVERVMGKILGKNGDSKEIKEELRSAVKNERFLIVLDDVWKGKLHDWNALWAPLSYGDDESRVIITTREEDVMKELGAIPSKMRRLSILGDEDCLEILKRYAFPNGFPSTSRGSSSSLESITREVVEKKVKGLPLAARLIGSSLRDETKESRWRRALQDIEETGKEHIMSVMKWSYLPLPNHLKQCFSLLSCFPKDERLIKSQVILFWIAHGYVVQREEGSIGGQSLEEIAEGYWDDLVKASLIQHYYDDCYRMHDLIHDFVTEVSAGACFYKGQIESFPEPKALRHVCLGGKVELPQNHSHIKKLRTLMTWRRSHVKIHRDQLRTVRVLQVKGYGRLLFMTLKANFTKMLHLRYLDLEGLYFIDALPQSLCNLYNLQVLLLPEVLLPDGMWKLVQLRHLRAGRYISKITRIGELTSLQTIGGRFCLFEDNGQCIRELGNLRQLRGKLVITGLRHVQETQWARDAQLENKVHLEELVLNTEDEDKDTHAAIENNTLEIEVFKSLRPHGDLKKLEIKNYHGHELPTWMSNLLNIVSLVLFNCNSLKKLPPLGHLPYLEKLRIENANKIDRIDKEFYGTDRDPVEVFPSLKELCLEDMNALKEWEELMVSGDKSQKKYFPSLKRLVVKRCKKLGRLPHIPPSLEMLEIDAVGLTVLALSELPPSLDSLDISGCNDLKALPELPPSLESLDIMRCKDLKALPELPPSLKVFILRECEDLKALSELPPSLESLHISGCNDLKALSELPPSLERLSISGCNDLKALPELPPSLKSLGIWGCNDLKALPELPPSLESLDIWGCNDLKALPELPPSLESLHIEECKDLKALPELPPSLESLHIEECKDLKALPELPPSLESLHIEECKDLKALPKLPPSLETLDILGCNDLKALPEFPPSLETLYIEECKDLKALPELPPSLERLYIEEWKDLKALPKLPPSLERLYIEDPKLKILHLHDCKDLKALPELPPWLERLHIEECKDLKALPELPPTVQRLRLYKCKDLEALPELPPSLKVFILRECEDLKALPELPPSLERLHIEECKDLKALPELPPSLESLHIEECKDLKALPELPPSLERLHIEECKDLKALPELPPSLKILHLHKCEDLKALPELPPSLKEEDLLIVDCPLLQRDGNAT